MTKTTGKLQWLKQPKDFRKRHDVKIITQLHGDSGRVFYEDLMCESLDHGGHLRFSEDVPYDNKMLAAVFDRDIDFVNAVMDTLLSLKLVIKDEDGTLFMAKVPEMTGSETAMAKYMRDRRAKDEVRTMGLHDNVTMTARELEELKQFYPSYWSEYIERLSAHKASTGKTYNSDFATVMGWLRKDIGEFEEDWQ